ncbi:MAG TPA: hypothetical protein PK247_02225, partial [Candidatus Goldiibacteriota bacterium]|nr:hypothetical protein [Candidatus Goldiibacteriota bacterium]
MKKIIFLTAIISAVIFIHGCKTAVSPTVPAATNTPNATQTIEAIVSGAEAIHATQTAVAVLSATPTPTMSVQFLTKWGSYGSADGQFDSPRNVAVDGSTGRVYVEFAFEVGDGPGKGAAP